MDFYKTKLTVFVFQTKSDAKLKYSDLLVYSCLSYYEKFESAAPDTKIAWHTGLARQTVAASIQRMNEVGLVAGREPQPNNIFVSKKGGGYAYWKCLVPDSDYITVPATMIFSLLLHYSLSKYKCRMSQAYLSSVLGLDRKTVQKSVKLLSDLQLLKPDTWGVTGKLVGDQTTLFREKGSSMEPIEIKMFEPEGNFFFAGMKVNNPYELPVQERPFCQRSYERSKKELLNMAKLLGLPNEVGLELPEKFIEKDGRLNLDWRQGIEDLATSLANENETKNAG